MFDKRSIYKRLEGRFVHEENFLKVLDQIERGIQTYQMVVTDFISPGMLAELEPLIKMERDFDCLAFGGFHDAERVRLIVFPDYMEVDREDFEVVLLKSKFPLKFETLAHRDILGSLMSQGFRREKIGDLFVSEDEIYIFVAEDIKDYISTNLERVRKVKVNFNAIALEDFIPPEKAFKEISGTVSSLRLDAVVAFATNVSRSKASNLIKGEMVKVNHRVLTQTTHEIQCGDLLSIRGFGRMRISDLGGKTKKDRLRLTVKKYI